MELKQLPLSELNRQSERSRVSMDQLTLTTPDRSLLWAPSELPPLVCLKEWSDLSPNVQCRYNQLYALGLLEQFIWLESQILCPLLLNILEDSNLPLELRTGLTNFYQEELVHTEMFWRLLQLAEPSFYPTRNFYFFNGQSTTVKLVEKFVSLPKQILVWVWMSIFFEERTLDFSKRYIRFNIQNPKGIDSNFVHVHHLHMLDELRHFMMDVHLLARYYDPAPIWKRFLAAQMFKLVIQKLTQPKMMSLAYLQQMRRELPEFTKQEHRQILLARPSLKNNSEFKNIHLSARSTPRTHELLSRYPECRSIQKLFV